MSFYTTRFSEIKTQDIQKTSTEKMFKNIMSVMVFLLYIISASHAQEANQQNKSASEAWQASIKDLTARENEIYSALKNADEQAEEKLGLELTALADTKLNRKAVYITANPRSSFSISLINEGLMYMGNYESGSMLFSKLDETARQTPAGKKIAERLAILKRSAIGERMLNFTQNNMDGQAVKFSDFKGKYVLVDFWASWCKPCRAENPNILKAYQQYKNKGFTVLGISLDEKSEAWKKAVTDDQMPWPQLSDLKGFKNEVSDYFGIQAIPSTLLINPDGEIIAKDLNGKALHRKLAALFKNAEINKAKNDSISKMERTERLKWIRDYISSNPSSASGAYFLSEFMKFDDEITMEQLEELLNKFNGAAKQSEYYIPLVASLNRKKQLLPGHMAPDFTLLQANGKPLTLSATHGKYVLIDFWASWCVPCRKAIPHLKEVYAKYKSRGFEMISLSADQVDASWKKALDAEKMPWLQVVDDFPDKFSPSRVGGMYEVRFLPFYVLLDKTGKILVYSGSEKEVELKLEQLFN
jgi:thiol-disulfide isomerase/thioredoxin